MSDNTQKQCAAQHFGVWMVRPDWLAEAVRSVRQGMWQPQDAVVQDAASGYEVVGESVAVIRIEGYMSRKPSTYGGTATSRVRVALNDASKDEDVEGIMLYMNSPGGIAEGLDDLYQTAQKASDRKPLHAFISGMACSAGYYAVSAADHITATRSSQIGSIGSMARIVDTSGAYEQEGVKVVVKSTGKLKGQGVDGVEVTEEYEEHIQDIVDQFGEFFFDAVAEGREMPRDAVDAYATGKWWFAEQSRDMGLIDEIGTMQDAILNLRQTFTDESRSAKARSAETRLRLAEAKQELW